ncbi:MAG: hypothetical protein IH956_06400, partial [Chloroflexi bacterium]|nr:hypothetical protein [Chloroflexota bacterium]
MMARISVSLPEDFMERLEPIKDKINVSQVCREALERRITAFERVAANGIGDLDLDGLVGRLREERDLVQGKFEDVARGNAVAWLSTTPYLEIKSVVEAQIMGLRSDGPKAFTRAFPKWLDPFAHIGPAG